MKGIRKALDDWARAEKASSEALPGEHYCLEHQGNHSHYAKENCSLCRLQAQTDPFPKICYWRQDGDWQSDVFESDCGHGFIFNEGTPVENEMDYCCYCGGALEQVLLEDSESVQPQSARAAGEPAVHLAHSAAKR